MSSAVIPGRLWGWGWIRGMAKGWELQHYRSVLPRSWFVCFCRAPGRGWIAGQGWMLLIHVILWLNPIKRSCIPERSGFGGSGRRTRLFGFGCTESILVLMSLSGYLFCLNGYLIRLLQL